jgi:HEAT repeat protein
VFVPSPLPRRTSAALRDAQDSKSWVRLSAVNDLVRLAHGEDRAPVLAALEQVLLRDSEAKLRAAAAVGLADVEAVSSVSVLLEALADPVLRVRQMVLLAIGELSPPGSTRCNDAIRRELSSTAPELRFQALLAAARVKIADLVDSLCRALRDADSHVRYVALRLIDEHVADATCEPSDETRLRRSAEPCLADPDAAVRVAAALLLAPQGGESARQVLVEAINSGLKLPAAVDEQALIEMIGDLALTQALPGLRRQARGWFGFSTGPYAWQAKVALAQLGEPRAVQEVARGLKSSRRDVRSMSVVAAGRARLSYLRPELEHLAETQTVDSELVTTALELISRPGTR